MDYNLLQGINEETKLVRELEESLGIPKEEFPEELLAEIRGSAVYGGDPMAGMSRQELRGTGVRDWVSDASQQQAAKPAYGGGGPARDLPAQQQADPKPGDFVKVGDELMKVARVEQMYGNAFVFFDQPGAKPVMINHLQFDKEISGRQVFSVAR